MKPTAIILIFAGLCGALSARPGQINPSSRKVVETALNGPADLRIAAIQECSTLPYCMRALFQGLQDQDAEVREAAARSLGFLGLRESVNNLREAMEKEQVPRVKAVMIWAIGSTRAKNAKEAVTAIEPMLGDQNPEIRRTAAFALGALRDPESVAKLKNQAESESEERVKVELYRAALSIELSDQDTQKNLIALLKSNDANTRLRVANTIHDLRVRAARDELKRAIILEENQTVRDAMNQAYITCIHR